jgi:hypothetical protein
MEFIMRVKRWDETLSSDSSNLILSALSDRHLQEIDDGRIKSDLSKLLAEQDWKGLCTYELTLETDVRSYSNARQILAFFQKRSDLSFADVDPKAVAWDTFMEAENLCLETNRLFKSYSSGRFCFGRRVEPVLYVAQQKISRILGDVPRLDELKIRFGPGATTQVKKRDASPRRKLSQMFCCSEDSRAALQPVLEEIPLWSQLVGSPEGTIPVRIDNSRVDFVRKTAKTDRTIAVEPSLTGMVQLGIGDFIAGRLRKEGLDLKHDQAKNKRLARLGSITGALATLDLSSASDTVSSGLVESLLPFEWWDFLRKFRCSVVKTPFGLRRLEKFSTMGNGFTFALETLIFFALAKASAEIQMSQEPVSVYGDDIIIGTDAFDLLVECLVATGFVVNKKKSFSTGPFRESCGGDYFSGSSVRPCYIKDSLSGHDLFILHNFYVREGRTDHSSFVRSFISDELAIYGPDGFGDGHLLGAHSLDPSNRDKGWGGYTFETYTYKPNRVFYKKPLSADYVFPAYSIYVSSDQDVDVATYPFEEKLLHRKVGLVRPPGTQSVYRGGSLSDTLPGVRGYKRIKIYTMG